MRIRCAICGSDNEPGRPLCKLCGNTLTPYNSKPVDRQIPRPAEGVEALGSSYKSTYPVFNEGLVNSPDQGGPAPPDGPGTGGIDGIVDDVLELPDEALEDLGIEVPERGAGGSAQATEDLLDFLFSS